MFFPKILDDHIVSSLNILDKTKIEDDNVIYFLLRKHTEYWQHSPWTHFSFYVWEIMHATIKKMNKHVMRLQKEVDDARDKYDAYQRKVSLIKEILVIVIFACV